MTDADELRTLAASPVHDLEQGTREWLRAVAARMDSRCGTCRFWGSDPGDTQGVYRPCRAVIHAGQGDEPGVWDDPPDDAKAYTVDGSGYFAALKCREDFGCVLHQPKEGT